MYALFAQRLHAKTQRVKIQTSRRYLSHELISGFRKVRIPVRILLVALLTTIAANGDPIQRRNWILDQLATPVAQPSIFSPPSTFRCAFDVTNYADAFSGMLGVLTDLGPLEISAYASERVYGSFTQSGREFKDASTQDSDSFAFELARSYMARDGHFGRLSSQYILFPKNKTAFLRLGVNMGIFEFGDSPWLLRLNSHIFFRAQGPENRTYAMQVEIGQTVTRNTKLTTARWRLGFLLGWTYKTRDEIGSVPLGETIRNEHMLFSIGPWVEYVTLYYILKIGIPWRVWLDKETYTGLNGEGKEEKIVHYPSDVRIPDFHVSLSLFL